MDYCAQNNVDVSQIILKVVKQTIKSRYSIIHLHKIQEILTNL